MAGSTGTTANLLRLIHAGSQIAPQDLISHSCDRLRRLARKMLRNYPVLRRWEQTDDILQIALLRLHRALSKVPLKSTRHFWNLASLQLNRALLDLVDQYKTALAPGRNHHTDRMGQAEDIPCGALQLHPDGAGEPGSLEEWTRFHEAVSKLPDEQREVFRLKWYDGLTLEQVAVVVGWSLRTVKRRWLSAVVLLGQSQSGKSPHTEGF